MSNMINMTKTIPLTELKPGKKAVVKELKTKGAMRRRLLDIGLIENTTVECLGRSPCGDPSAFLIRGAVIALRCEDCGNILLEAI
jgi:ferrous iron transport protein A